MYPRQGEPTICEVLSDPMVGAVMRADRVTQGDIEAMLSTLARRREASRPGGDAGSRRSLSCARPGACEF